MITLLMLGDSLVEWGDWQRFLPGVAVVNRGLAGEMTGELAARLHDEMAACPDPDAVLVQSGTNNLLFGDLYVPYIFETMLPRLRHSYPHQPILVCSLTPMPIVPAADLAQVNQGLARATAAVANGHFLDLVGPFTERCLPITLPGFLDDQVHLSSRGYQVWADEISRALARLFPDRTAG